MRLIDACSFAEYARKKQDAGCKACDLCCLDYCFQFWLDEQPTVSCRTCFLYHDGFCERKDDYASDSEACDNWRMKNETD